MKLSLILTLIVFGAIYSVSQTKMPYQADDVRKAIQRFSDWVPPEKDDFETWDAYFKRMPVYDTNKVYTFIYKDAFTYYNIDDSTLSVTGPSLRGCDDNGTSYLRYTVDAKEKVIRKYSASNSFGRTVRVTEKQVDRYILDSLKLVIDTSSVRMDPSYPAEVVSVDPYKLFTSDAGTDYYYIDVELKMAPALARKVHKKLNMALRFRLKGYFDGRLETDYFKATINDPLELTTYDHFAEAVADEMIFYTSDTKQIVLTVKCK